jgi:hypothetical protein
MNYTSKETRGAGAYAEHVTIIAFGVARTILEEVRIPSPAPHFCFVCQGDGGAYPNNAFERFKTIQVRFILIPLSVLLEAIAAAGGEH